MIDSNPCSHVDHILNAVFMRSDFLLSLILKAPCFSELKLQFGDDTESHKSHHKSSFHGVLAMSSYCIDFDSHLPGLKILFNVISSTVNIVSLLGSHLRQGDVCKETKIPCVLVNCIGISHNLVFQSIQFFEYI